MTFEFTWKITYIWACEFVWANWTAKQDFVLEEITDKEKKQSICVTARWQTVEYVWQRSILDIVTCKLILSCREYNGKFYNSATTFWVRLVEAYNHKWWTHIEATDRMPAHDEMPF